MVPPLSQAQLQQPWQVEGSRRIGERSNPYRGSPVFRYTWQTKHQPRQQTDRQNRRRMWAFEEETIIFTITTTQHTQAGRSETEEKINIPIKQSHVCASFKEVPCPDMWSCVRACVCVWTPRPENRNIYNWSWLNTGVELCESFMSFTQYLLFPPKDRHGEFLERTGLVSIFKKWLLLAVQ